jgi:RNA polymerase sigma-70 factor (ECF subfamily)
MIDQEGSNRLADGIAETTSTATGAATTNDRDKPTLEELEAAILTLRPHDREIFLAHRLDHLSYRQMAEITGLSIHQIEKSMAHAIGDLHRALRSKVPRRRRWWPF